MRAQVLRLSKLFNKALHTHFPPEERSFFRVFRAADLTGTWAQAEFARSADKGRPPALRVTSLQALLTLLQREGGAPPGEASALFVTFGVLYYFVVDHRLLRRGILPQSIWAHFAFCWTVRVGTFILYYLAIQFLYATGDGATNPRGGNELGPAGDTPKNLFLLFIAGLTVQSFIAHALARLSPPKKNKKAYVTDALLRYA